MLTPLQQARLLQADLGSSYDPQKALDFLRMLEKENRGTTPVRNLEKLFQQPPQDDVLLQTIYETPFVRGDIVLAGKKTRAAHPMTQYYPVHFRKTYLEKMAGWESPTSHEEKQTMMVWGHFEEEGCPGRVPRPLGCEPDTFRSELIQAKTVGALSPVHNCNDPQELARQITEARKHPSDLRKLWAGLEAVRDAMAMLHSGGMLHKDAHRENLMIAYDGQGNPSGHLIDFETSEEDPRFATPEWARATYEDCKLLIEEATLVRMCAQPGEIPKEYENTQLSREVQFYARSSPKIMAILQIFKAAKEQAEKSKPAGPEM